MLQESINQIITSSQLFKGISFENLSGTVRNYRPGKILNDCPDSVPSVGVIISGRIDVYSVALDGKDIHLTTLSIGDCFGICNLMTDGELDTVLRCREETTILYIPKATLRDEMAKNSTLALNYADICNKKIQFLIRKIELLTMQSCRGKIITYLLTNKDEQGCVALSCSREELARHLGVSRAAFFRELAALQSLGALRTEKNALIILKLDCLEELLYL